MFGISSLFICKLNREKNLSKAKISLAFELRGENSK